MTTPAELLDICFPPDQSDLELGERWMEVGHEAYRPAHTHPYAFPGMAMYDALVAIYGRDSPHTHRGRSEWSSRRKRKLPA